MKALIFPLSILALGMCLPVSGQTKTFPYPYTQEDLPNGLRLVTIPTDSPNLASVYIVVQTGSRNEVEAHAVSPSVGRPATIAS